MRWRGSSTLYLILFGLSMMHVSSPARSQSANYENRFTLHVDDAIGAPGGRVAVVFRAYASRPIGQGQLCFAAQGSEDAPGGGTEPSPLLSFEGSAVFSSAGDAQVEFFETADVPPRYVLRFTSPSASVNDYHGPLAVVFFDLHPDAVPGSAFELLVDAVDTQFLDEDGYPIDFDLIPGELRVRAAGDPYSIAADAGIVARGDVAEIGVRTAEPVGWTRGRLALRYDPELLPGQPTVRMDPRHGLASFEYDVPYAGLLVVDFASPDASLNRVPGSVISIGLESSRPARPKASTRVWLDRSLSWVADEDGRLFPLVFEDAQITIANPSGRTAGGQRSKGDGSFYE